MRSLGFDMQGGRRVDSIDKSGIDMRSGAAASRAGSGGLSYNVAGVLM